MAFLKNWRLILFGGAVLIALSATTAAYILLQRNIQLKSDLRDAVAQVEVLEDARERDALAAKQLIEVTAAEQARLTAQITALSEIQDAPSRDYLNTPVPNSVLRLLNP